MRNKLAKFAHLNIGGPVLEMYGVTLDDLDVLEAIEDALRPTEEEGAADGIGSEVVTECG